MLNIFAASARQVNNFARITNRSPRKLAVNDITVTFHTYTRIVINDNAFLRLMLLANIVRTFEAGVLYRYRFDGQLVQAI